MKTRLPTLGRGWIHSYERSLTPKDGYLVLRLTNGYPTYFTDPDADQTFTMGGSSG